MGIYLNPGNIKFQFSLNSEIYMDKSLLIALTNAVLNTQDRFVCVSRPRRFGKSMAADMLAAYYGRGYDSGGQFKNLKIAGHPSFQKHLNQYHVIHLNMLDFWDRTKTISQMLEQLKRRLLHELKKAFGDVECFDWDDLSTVLEEVYSEKHIPFVFLIDEWDSIFRVYQQDTESQKLYLDFLRNILKDKSYVALAYMTGILPIKKYGEHSALNMFDGYSMTNQKQLAEFTGFTEEEVRLLCEKYSISFDETKKWYDGYNVNGISIYNPKSVTVAMMTHIFDSYWTQTETYEALKIHIMRNENGLRNKIIRMIAGEHISINIQKFQNDMCTFESADDVLTLLIHLGYLTYDFDTKTAWIPNSEVQQEFINSIEDGGWEPVMASIQQSEELLKATLAGNAGQVAAAIEQVHQDNTSILKYNDENALACVISLAYYSARRKYQIIRELPSGKGFADLVFIPFKVADSPALVIELKKDKSPETAIDQIRRKDYPDALKGVSSEILLVGINYDEEKKHTCVIEKISQ